MMLEWDRTNEGSGVILDNKKGITDWETLKQYERRISKIRLAKLEFKRIDAKETFDKAYFLFVHKNLFQDVYPWAGTIREVDLYKGDSAFAPARFLNNSLDSFFDNLKKDNYLKGFSKEETAELSSYYMLELNFLHPFREGNGRTKRFYMKQLLKGAGFNLGLEKINPDQLVLADILAFDDNEADIKANPSYFKALINESIEPLQGKVEEKKKDNPIAELNRFLWVYDRYDSRAYFSNKKSLEEAETNLESLFESEQGKAKIKDSLNRIILFEKKLKNGTAEYRNEIIKKANQYKTQVETNIIKKESKGMEKEAPIEKEIGQEQDLARKLDLFYSSYDPYGRYDATGFFSPKYEGDNEGLTQTRESLSSKEGRKGIDNFLKEVIREDERPEMIRQAKKLRLELMNPKNYSENIKQFLKNKKPDAEKQEAKKVTKKQKEIK